MGLLGRAKTMMQAWTAPEPASAQGYSVACAEGHRLRGHRTEGYQALRCPTCGDGIFVLPRSPLPEPPIPSTAARSKAPAPIEAFTEDDPLLLRDPPTSASSSTADVEIDQSRDDPDVAEIDWVDEVPEPIEPKPKPGGPSPTNPQAKPKLTPKAGPTPARKPGPVSIPASAPAPAVEVDDRSTLREWAWRNRNRLMPAGVVLIVLAAVAIQQRRQWLEGLPEVAEIGRTEGLRALDSGEFQLAKKRLSEASRAVKALGGRYEGGEAILQGALEAAIFTDLASSSLEEMVDEAAKTGEGSDWSSHFASYYKGKSIILETAISAVPEPGKAGSSYQVDYQICTGRGPRPENKGRVDLAGFQLFELSQPKVGDQKIFGARLKSLEFDVVSRAWVLTLQPDSGVFITHPKALQAIGWPQLDSLEEAKP